MGSVYTIPCTYERLELMSTAWHATRQVHNTLAMFKMLTQFSASSAPDLYNKVGYIFKLRSPCINSDSSICNMNNTRSTY